MQPMKEAQELSKRAKRYQELDHMAYDRGPNMDDKLLFSLRFEEMSYVLSMAHLYMLARLGAVSADMGAKIKRRYILRTEHIHNELINTRYMYQRQIANSIIFSKDMNKLTALLKEGSAEALPKALEIIDSLSGSYIFTKIYYNAVHCGKYTEAVKCVTEEPDRQVELIKCFERMLSEITSGKLPGTFKELTEDELRVLASRIPAKEAYDSSIPKELLLKP